MLTHRKIKHSYHPSRSFDSTESLHLVDNGYRTHGRFIRGTKHSDGYADRYHERDDEAEETAGEATHLRHHSFLGGRGQGAQPSHHAHALLEVKRPAAFQLHRYREGSIALSCVHAAAAAASAPTTRKPRRSGTTCDKKRTRTQPSEGSANPRDKSPHARSFRV